MEAFPFNDMSYTNFVPTPDIVFLRLSMSTIVSIRVDVESWPLELGWSFTCTNLHAMAARLLTTNKHLSVFFPVLNVIQLTAYAKITNF